MECISASYFISDDLSSYPGYRNVNSDWQKYYNACIVAPIRIPFSDQSKHYEPKEIDPKTKKNTESSSGMKSDVVGFICVDNKKGGFQANEELSKNLIAVFADPLFNLFYLKSQLDEKNKNAFEEKKDGIQN